MKIGITAYNLHATEFHRLAVAADEAGFASLWLGEHVLLPVGFTEDHPSTTADDEHHHSGPIIDPDTELVDPLIQLGAAAAATDRIMLATGVFILPLRHPLAAARSICTVQELAEGRFMFGVGMGWLEAEFAALDQPYRTRVSRFEESIEVVQSAIAGGVIDHEGKYFSIHDVQVTKRATPVPFILGGNSERAIERAVRLGDGWFSSGTPTYGEALRLRGELQAAADASGRDRPFELIFRAGNGEADTIARYRDDGFEHVTIWSDEVWPLNLPIEDRRAILFEAADRLGLNRAVAD